MLLWMFSKCLLLVFHYIYIYNTDCQNALFWSLSAIVCPHLKKIKIKACIRQDSPFICMTAISYWKTSVFSAYFLHLLNHREQYPLSCQISSLPCYLDPWKIWRLLWGFLLLLLLLSQIKYIVFHYPFISHS